MKEQNEQSKLSEINRPMNEELFNNLKKQYQELAKIKVESELEKQAIEEIAEGIFQNCNCGLFFSEAEKIARFVIEEQGYRKQSEGEWIIKKGGYYQRLVCSVCGKLSIATFDYCPNCGAHMKGGAE